jgi:hypothetical protein
MRSLRTGSKGFLLFLLLFLLAFSGCLSGPLPEDMPNTQAPTPTPAPSIESLNFISFDSVSYPEPEAEFAELTPELSGLIQLPFFGTVDVVANDLSVMNHPRRLQILASIESKYTQLYVKPDRETDTIVYFSIYKMNDSKSAEEILEAYSENWNKRLFNASGAQIWIWDGYIDEIAGRAMPLGKNSMVYWNPEASGVFLSSNVLENHPTLTKTGSPLYSVHGETVKGPYFIMIDVKTDLQDIQNKTASIFMLAAEDIFQGLTPLSGEKLTSDLNDSETLVNITSIIEAEKIKKNLRDLLDDYLAGNVSKKEYESFFEKYSLELENLSNST